jgi:DNA-binding response OmpR family regulator
MDKLKILIIDDEKDFVEILRERIELEGYEVLTAHDGEEGLKKAQKQKPDLIICDVRMPKKDGFEVLKALKQDKGFHTPFIMLTAVDDFDKIKEAYEDKANFYVTKPVDLARLLNNVRIVLNLSKLEQAPE